jgi:hypothetical protein
MLLFGCSLGGETQNPISDTNYRTGNSGLELQLLDGAPPDNVYEATTFQVGLEVRDSGASDIANGRLVLNYEPDYMYPLSQQTMQLGLKGKSIANPDGEADVRFFNIKTKNLEALSETHKSLVSVSACYAYQTVASEGICVDSDIYNRIQDKACKAETLQLDSQGAPLAVTKIEPKFFIDDNGKLNPSFLIFIENKGNGNVINKNKISDFCSNLKVDKDDWNKIEVSANLGGMPLRCEPLPFKLKGQNDFVRCGLDNGLDKPEAAYTSVIDVTLDYGYTFTVSKEVTIDKLKLT